MAAAGPAKAPPMNPAFDAPSLDSGSSTHAFSDQWLSAVTKEAAQLILSSSRPESNVTEATRFPLPTF